MNTTLKEIEVRTLKAIKRGNFKNHYLIYSRKSTDEADNQKNSIIYQGKENRRFATKEYMQIANVTVTGFCTNGVVSEKHSGFKESDELSISSDGTVKFQIDRPKFQQLVQHLNNGHFKGVICLCWDRISRNRGDDTIIRKLMKNGVEVRFAYATYDQSSSGELHMDIDGMFAQHHSRVTSEKIRLATRSKREEGKCTYRAPIGYLNTGSIDHKPFDPERAPIIKEMFELYASGDWSLSDLARHVAKQGLTTPPMRSRRTKSEIAADDDEETNKRPKISHPLRKNRIQNILSNPFYIGKIVGPDGDHIPSTSHEPLIDTETFNQVQKRLTRKRVSIHYTEKLEYPFRGFVRCAQCKRTYTPYSKKGIQYFNVRCPDDCKNTMKNCNFDFVSGKMRDLLGRLVFSDEELSVLDARANTEIALLVQNQRKIEQSMERRCNKMRDELAYLRANQLSLLQSGLYSPQGLQEERAKLELKLDDIAQQEAVTEASIRELVEDVTKCSELLKNLCSIYDLAIPCEKERLIKSVCSELFLDQNTAKFQPQIGFENIFERKVLLCAQTKGFSELLEPESGIRIVLSKLENLLL